MDKLIRVGVPLELKGDDGLIVGYANKAIPDDANHLIPAEVWLAGLQRYFVEGMPVKLLHRPELVVGETAWLKVLGDGLVLASRPLYPEIRGLVERGLLTAYSVGFIPKAWVDRADGIREFTDLELVEVSYVDLPMNPGSYFEVVPKMLEGHEIYFDAQTGTVTVSGLQPDEMAQLASLLQGALSKAGIGSVGNLQTIEFKAAAPMITDDAPSGAGNGQEDSMNLLKQIWDFLRGKTKEAPEIRSETMETQPEKKAEETVLPAPETKETPVAELEVKFSEIHEQLQLQGAAIAELKEAVVKLAQVVDSFVPPANSTPVLDTSQGREHEKKFKWGLLGPTG